MTTVSGSSRHRQLVRQPARFRSAPVVVSLLCGLFGLLPILTAGQDAEFSRRGADSCIACHGDDETLAVFRTPHGSPSDPRSPFGHGQLQCEACHGPGGEHAGRVRRGQERPAIISFSDRYPASVETENGMCLDCHNDGNTTVHWQGDLHAAADVGCSDCHSSHAPSDPVLMTASQPAVCADCHRQQHTETMKAFAHPMFEGQMDCTSCHGVHADVVATSLVRQTVNDTCYQCHAEVRGPYVWEHAPVSEDCGLCHAPHGSNQPAMLTRRGPLLCQSCHSQQGHPSIPQQPGGLAREMPSQFLLGQNCMNCHSQVHGSNHPSGSKLMR